MSLTDEEKFAEFVCNWLNKIYFGELDGATSDMEGYLRDRGFVQNSIDNSWMREQW